MKQVFLFASLLCTSLLFAQEMKMVRNNQNQIELTEIVPVDSLPAAQLYLSAQLFLNNSFQNVRQSAQIRDEKNKTVATKASIPVNIESGDGEVISAKTFFTLIIQSKDNGYKYTINDFYFGYTEETGITSYASFNDRLGVVMTRKQWQQVENQTEGFMKNFVQDLKDRMLQKDILCKEVMQAFKKKKLAKINAK